MTRSVAPQLPKPVQRQLEALGERIDALDYPDLEHPDYHRLEIERQIAVNELLDTTMRLYAEATGRCADHLASFLYLDATRVCRNSAKGGTVGPVCGTHLTSWEMSRARPHARLAGLTRQAENQVIADRFRVHGIAATVGAEHLVVPIADAVAIADLLDRADTALANERFETARRIDRDDDYSEEALDRDAAQEDDACPDDPDGLHHAGCGCEDVDPVDPNGGGS